MTLTRIQNLFERALEFPEDQRDQFLDEECKGDAELRKELGSLLESHSKANRFLESTISSAAFEIFLEDQSRQLIGQHLGSYKILSEIGRGGMGAVYLAERSDDQFRKKVAIKLVQPGFDPDQIRRFHQERQILAQLDHPNIARLIDGGTTSEGIPYLVMDYVEGLPVDEYCAKNNLTINDRLNLFRTICSAVQHAHRSLIVHLDIKPTNILVTSDGTPKLLDFGIARLLNPATVLQQERTATVLRRMTPEYASPEQIRGEAVSVSSDIYSLGILLYRTLTGYLPYHFKNRDMLEMARIVCEEEPEKPSTVIARTVLLPKEPLQQSDLPSASPEKLKRQLQGDIDNILMMALRKEPQRRYSSVEQFSEDVRRHLDGLPVIARKDTLRYRSIKFAGRNKGALAAALLIVIVLFAGIISTIRQAQIARHERDRARLEANKAEQINTFVQSMLSSADPEVSGKDVTVAQILDEASQRVETELANQPEISSEVKRTLAKTYMGLGLYDPAEKLLKSAVQTKLKVTKRSDPEFALLLNDLAFLLVNKGDVSGAEPLYREALSTLEKTRGRENLDVASVMNNLAELMMLKGDLDASEKIHIEELRIRRSLLSNTDPQIAESLNDLGVVLGTKGKFVEAEKLHREAVNIIRKTRGPEHLDVAASLSSLASMVGEVNPKEAQPLFEEALRIREKRLGKDHPLTAWTKYNYAYALYDSKEYARAEKLLMEVLALRGKTLGDSHSMTHSSLQLLGRVLTDSGRAPEGENPLRESLDIRKNLLPEGHWLIASSQSALGDCLLKMKRYVEAEEHLLASYESLKASLGPDHERTRETAASLSLLYMEQKR